ncbi:histone-lysine N-methyltransferase SETMAR [Trichonephila inaurata madagascariensis]|uniref:Histone-lysine N-methyltransferase SETMAR n=1 Tax=Trichonephila inaurata madagascariensis TaxID=2747483 RepID=A0A8X6X3I6_9ARAC|nr:histone-lysine N-methyltransferase SETMAR [Trichonephila inaurata madagascariensis]
MTGLRNRQSKVGASVVINAGSLLTFIHRNSYSSEAKWTYRRSSFGGCLLYDFKVGLSAAASKRQICQAFGDSAANERTARHWFQKFRAGDLSLCDKARTGQPQALDDEALQAAIEEDRSQTCELARQFNSSSETVRLQLHA